ncbi:uncharacterized protein LOC121870717 [Homarus americanus]|uniref:Uncharacterized protein n=1 Tax=Homarus americanus TaxID=6706 RepID=A0A8J5JZ76_HOMAM|nr:uncharacterized protein LOC121870717 [Homarus americanus]KAG7165266.1 hypothetical protein Hamer_G021473 [Homarus americanus]
MVRLMVTMVMMVASCSCLGLVGRRIPKNSWWSKRSMMPFLTQTPEGGSALMDPTRGGSALMDPTRGGSALMDPTRGGSALMDPTRGEKSLMDPTRGGSALMDPTRGRSVLINPNRDDSTILTSPDQKTLIYPTYPLQDDKPLIYSTYPSANVESSAYPLQDSANEKPIKYSVYSSANGKPSIYSAYSSADINDPQSATRAISTVPEVRETPVGLPWGVYRQCYQRPLPPFSPFLRHAALQATLDLLSRYHTHTLAPPPRQPMRVLKGHAHPLQRQDHHTHTHTRTPTRRMGGRTQATQTKFIGIAETPTGGPWRSGHELLITLYTGLMDD